MDHSIGMERAEGHRLIDALTAHAIQPRFVDRHEWRTGDVVI
jgi:alpha-ketoglutarate-dependent taurine dioxygenase